MNYLSLLTPFTLFLFTACGSVETSSTSTNRDKVIYCQSEKMSFTTNSSQKLFQTEAPNNIKILLESSQNLFKEQTFDNAGVYELFTTEYYWATQTEKNFNYTNFTTPQALIEALKYKKDRWSFAIEKERFDNTLSQKNRGFGFACQDIDEGCLVTYVQIDSPVDKIDLRRGDTIVKINNQKATQNYIYQLGQKSKSVTSFTIKRTNTKEICNGAVTPRDYTYKVILSKVMKTKNNQSVGYLRLDSFLGDEALLKQIDKAFDRFKKTHIEKLVIDLRYNGGGSVDIASELLDRLSIKHEGEEQFTLAWNSSYQYNDKKYTFDLKKNSLNIEQLLFLTTTNTASASELIISAMKPYLNSENLTVIGSKTHGKPVGMNGRSDGVYYYFLINFVVKNSLGFYDYFTGLPVTKGCQIVDDPYHEMGDPNELMLKSALNYIDKGSCQ
jgi:C-terminal processing protease CtpA/Prc